MLTQLINWFLFGFIATLGVIAALYAVRSPVVQTSVAFAGALILGFITVASLWLAWN